MKQMVASKPMMTKDKVAAMMNQKQPKQDPDFATSNLAKELGKRQHKRQLTAV